ncbi:MAG: hypothetical protein GY705_26410 [Bacteroidetes bacterium]|nr:hypothetical protein [Bacteroidota bacterium]
MIPFVWLFGDNIFTIRALSGVTAGFTCVAITLAASTLKPSLTKHDKIQILWLSAISGLVMLMTLIWTPDTPLLLFSALAFWQLFKAIDSDSHFAWIWTGLFFALAFLAKANTGLYVAIVGIWMLAHPKGRQHLSTPWPWIGFSIILLALIPVFIWNIENDWAFFKFQGGHAFSPEHTSTSTDSDSISIQFDQVLLLLLSYFLFAGLTTLTAFRSKKESITKQNNQAASRHLAFTILLSSTAFFILIALYKNFIANWAIISVLILFILGIPEIIQRQKSWLWFQVATITPALAIIISLNFLPATVALAVNWKNALVWDEIYQIMRREQSKLPETTILSAISYQDAAQLAFYERSRWNSLPDGHAVPALNISGRSNHFAYFWKGESYRNHNMLVLEDNNKKNHTRFFCKSTPIGSYEVSYLQQSIRKFNLFYGEGFLGRPDVTEKSTDRSICRS